MRTGKLYKRQRKKNEQNGVKEKNGSLCLNLLHISVNEYHDNLGVQQIIRFICVSRHRRHFTQVVMHVFSYIYTYVGFIKERL